MELYFKTCWRAKILYENAGRENLSAAYYLNHYFYVTNDETIKMMR